MLGLSKIASTAAAAASANADGVSAPSAEPKPNVEPPTPEQAAPAPLDPKPAVPGKLMMPDTFDSSKLSKAPVKSGDGLHNLTYDGKPFEAQINATVSRSLSWWDNVDKKFINKGTPPPGEKRLGLNIDLRQARLAHLPNPSQEALEHKRLYDFIKRIEQQNFALATPGFVNKVGKKNLPNPVPYSGLYCASAIIGDIEEEPYYEGSNGKWYLKPLSFALDVYFEPRSAAMPNEPLVSKESTLKRVTFEKDADGKRVSQQPSTITDGDWLVDAIGGCSGVVVIKTGTTKVTPQNKVKLSWTLKKAFLEPSTWGGQGNGGGSDDTTDNVSF